MLLMAQSFQYATTNSSDVRAAAWKTVRAMEFLHNVTGTPGFAARAAVKCGDKRPGGDSGPCHAPGADPKTCGWVNSTVRRPIPFCCGVHLIRLGCCRAVHIGVLQWHR